MRKNDTGAKKKQPGKWINSRPVRWLTGQPDAPRSGDLLHRVSGSFGAGLSGAVKRLHMERLLEGSVFLHPGAFCLLAVALLLRWPAFGSFRYKFSLFLFAVAMAEALLLVEGGDRLYHANLWWGPFICFWVFWLESVSVFLQQTRSGAVPRWRLAVCAAALAWHIVSGVCFLVMLLQGVSYNVPILTYNLW